MLLTAYGCSDGLSLCRVARASSPSCGPGGTALRSVSSPSATMCVGGDPGCSRATLVSNRAAVRRDNGCAASPPNSEARWVYDPPPFTRLPHTRVPRPHYVGTRVLVEEAQRSEPTSSTCNYTLIDATLRSIIGRRLFDSKNYYTFILMKFNCVS